MCANTFNRVVQIPILELVTLCYGKKPDGFVVWPSDKSHGVLYSLEIFIVL